MELDQMSTGTVLKASTISWALPMTGSSRGMFDRRRPRHAWLGPRRPQGLRGSRRTEARPRGDDALFLSINT